MKFVLDSSIIIDGRIIRLIEEGKIKGTVIVPNAVLAELEHQANEGKEIGFTGLDVLKKLRKLCKEKDLEFIIEGPRPRIEEIRGVKLGEVDALIKSIAKEWNAVLVTGDRVQKLSAEIEGVECLYLKPEKEVKELSFEKYFSPETMSIHLKEGCKVLAKNGTPGNVKVEVVGKELSLKEIIEISEEIIEEVERNDGYYFEMEREGALVIQMGKYRVVIAKPPFSERFEITIVRPIVKMKFEDYKMSEKLRKRLEEKADGIVLCGPPGSGKSTFAAALAEFYQKKGKIVKTIESPRDLQVNKEITQYSALEGDFDKTKEIVLLVRPDYTIYDEVRTMEDFSIYADMRLTGIGMVGVVHAKNAIDAIHRFITKIDLGIVPQVVDTVILIEGGGIKKVYELNSTVKVPYGMTERDLARPVVQVRDFESGREEYEIYKFGEETVIIPVKKEESEKKIKKIDRILRKYFSEYRIEEENGKINVYVNKNEFKFFRKKELRTLEKLAKQHNFKFVRV